MRTVAMKKVQSSSNVRPMLTDLYQIRMAYVYWRSNTHKRTATFDVYFRTAPFNGSFAILAGVNECLSFLEAFSFDAEEMDYLREILGQKDEAFMECLSMLSCRDLKITGASEGTVVFPNVPVLTVTGPLITCQLIESTILNLLSFSTLMATNAARMRLVEPDATLIEFGLRRAQGPDGALSASRYAYLGGFNGTSNVLAGKKFDIPVMGTHAHAFITAYDDLPAQPAEIEDIFNEAKQVRETLFLEYNMSDLTHIRLDQVTDGELLAFCAFASGFPNAFTALLDTIDTLGSGLPNFLAVLMTLSRRGTEVAAGVRLDSGDLAYLSREIRKILVEMARRTGIQAFLDVKIFASNDINEDLLLQMNVEGHCVDAFGIGTNLVTCQNQPSLGMVYKLADIDGKSRMKLSEDISKCSLPHRKVVYRFFSVAGTIMMDFMTLETEPPPLAGERVYACHITDRTKRCWIEPVKVQLIHKTLWEDGVALEYNSIHVQRDYAASQLKLLRCDMLRPKNPTPYKVSCSKKFFLSFEELWERFHPLRTVMG